MTQFRMKIFIGGKTWINEYYAKRLIVLTTCFDGPTQSRNWWKIEIEKLISILRVRYFNSGAYKNLISIYKSDKLIKTWNSQTDLSIVRAGALQYIWVIAAEYIRNSLAEKKKNAVKYFCGRMKRAYSLNQCNFLSNSWHSWEPCSFQVSCLPQKKFSPQKGWRDSCWDVNLRGLLWNFAESSLVIMICDDHQ